MKNKPSTKTVGTTITFKLSDKLARMNQLGEAGSLSSNRRLKKHAPCIKNERDKILETSIDSFKIQNVVLGSRIGTIPSDLGTLQEMALFELGMKKKNAKKLAHEIKIISVL